MTLKKLEAEIERKARALMDLAHRIETIDRVIDVLPQEMREDEYVDQVVDMLDDFNSGCEDLLSQVEEYVRREDTAEVPKEMWVRVLRKGLR